MNIRKHPAAELILGYTEEPAVRFCHQGRPVQLKAHEKFHGSKHLHRIESGIVVGDFLNPIIRSLYNTFHQNINGIHGFIFMNKGGAFF